MNFLTLVKNNKEYYLNYNGVFSENIREILPIQVEFISINNEKQFFRIKCFNNYYITNTNGNILLCEKNDNNILYKQSLDTKIYFVVGSYLYNNNMTLSIKEYEPLTRTITFNNYSEDICFGSGTVTLLQRLFLDGIVTMDINLEKEMTEEFNKARNIINSCNEKRVCDLLSKDVCFQKLLSFKKIKEFISSIFNHYEYHLTTYTSNRVNKNNCVPGGWHVDYPYHDIQQSKDGYPKEILGLQLLILLDDFTVENGGTQYILGSHIHRKFPNENDLNSNKEYYRQLTGKRGSVVIWLGKLWHTEGKSHIDEYRSALLANFSPLNVKAKDNVINMFRYENEGFKIEKDKIVFI